MSFATNFFVNSTGGDILEMRLCSSPLPAIVQALLTLPSSCPLQLVTLDISINNNTDFNPSEIDWSPLFLPSLFSIIRQINVRIRATNDGKSVLPSRIMSSLAVNAQLMRMVERRLLIVTAEEGGWESYRQCWCWDLNQVGTWTYIDILCIMQFHDDLERNLIAPIYSEQPTCAFYPTFQIAVFLFWSRGDSRELRGSTTWAGEGRK